MKKKLRIIFIIIVFVISSIVAVNILLNGDKILINFSILSLDNKYTSFTLKHSNVSAAEFYKIEIRDQDNLKIYELETKKTINNFTLTNLNYDEEYSIMVYAYDEVGDYRPASEAYTFKWEEATFLNENIILGNDDYLLNIDGNLKDKKYKIVITSNDEEIMNERLVDNQITLGKDLFINKEVVLKAKILCEDVLIDEIDLFSNINPVSDVVIKSPSSKAVIPYNDVTVVFEGGENASLYTIKLYEDKKEKFSTTTKKKIVVISASLFEIDSEYSLEIIASYDQYSKSDKVDFTISDKQQLKPVYISNNWKYIKKGSKIELKSHSESAKIYYTLNGKNPESFGILYTEPIEITEDVVLKTVAVEDNKINSVIKEYEINVGTKEKLKVYLSPSNQSRNYGVSEVGYTNEQDEMNDIADYVEERLEKHGVKVYRNNPGGNINLWLKDSNYYGVDIHLAIHSNASNAHTAYGIETWIHNETSNTLGIASKIQDNLISIYPYKDKPYANRGVKYANGALGECNDDYLPFGILVEVAYHDIASDAEWIMQNKKLIGYNLADSILEYYQIL